MLKKFKNYLKYKVDWALVLFNLCFLVALIVIGIGLYFLFEYAWLQDNKCK